MTTVDDAEEHSSDSDSDAENEGEPASSYLIPEHLTQTRTPGAISSLNVVDERNTETDEVSMEEECKLEEGEELGRDEDDSGSLKKRVLT